MLLGPEVGVVLPGLLDGHSFDGGVGGVVAYIETVGKVVCWGEEGGGSVGAGVSSDMSISSTGLLAVSSTGLLS